MKKHINILYVGNNLTNKTGYNSTIAVLCSLLKEQYKIIVVSDKINKILRLFDMCWAVFKYRNQIDYILIDTFSTTNFYATFLVSQIAFFFKIKYIPILHGGNLPYRLESSKKMSDMIFSNSYTNVAPSNYLKSIFEKRGFKTIHIPNILNISEYKFKQRKLFNPYLLYVRAFDKIYNPTMAVAVLKGLKCKYPQAKLCMIGPFKDESYQQTLAKIMELNLENCVEITGVLPKEEWHVKSRAYDIFINTTNVDNTPVSIMEAMALGLPIVSTNVGGLPFLINHKKEGILVNKNDTTQMTKEIINLIENPAHTIQLTTKAREKVKTFDWSHIKHLWYNILK